MIIKELVLHNFGVYASTNKFEFSGSKPIVLIGGMNGRGKTTFLEAVLLVLYGSNSFAYTESGCKTYGQYLNSYVNKSDGSMQTYIDLEFVMDSEHEEIYKIHREWEGGKKRTIESISVYKDGQYNRFLTDNWTMFIENILPSGLSSFFFFDGEKIAELAVENTSNQMKESIKSLLGISVLDLLRSDLNRIINRTSKNKLEDAEAKEIENLRIDREQAITRLAAVDNEIEQLKIEKEKLLQKLEKLHHKYTAKGGDIVTQRQELFQKRSTIAVRIEGCKEQLINDAASELPFVLVKNFLMNIRENAEIAQDEKMFELVLKKMESLFLTFEKYNLEDREGAKKFISFVKQKAEKKGITPSYNLSDITIFKLQVLLDEQLLYTKLSIKKRQEELVKLQKEADQLDSYLSIDIDEKVVAKTYRKIKETEEKIISLNVKLNQLQEDRRICNGEAIAATSIFSKKVEGYLKRLELNDDSDRIIKYSHIATKILDEYKVRLQRNKIGIVAETMTACHKKLSNKQNLIDCIEMDPVTLDLKYLNKQGEEVDKSSLSAGEKQLMVISLLWSLALCSKKKLPVIIDTPLSRLDSIHRVSLIETYFPQASEQTIILSTDSEIDKVYYNMMKENIGDEYTLQYDDMSQSTSIVKGYFSEEN